MIKESIIRPPVRAYFVRRYQWQIKAISAFEKRMPVVNCAAEIVSVMTFHLDNRYAHESLNYWVTVAKENYDQPMINTGDWFPYSNTYFEKCLLKAYTRYQIDPAVKVLEKMNWISRDVPKDITSFYRTDKSKWLKLNYPVIQGWIEANYDSVVDFDNMPKPEQIVKIPDPITPIVTSLCKFHSAVNSKTKSYVYDERRKKMVRARLSSDGRSELDCVKAILGNRHSDFYQGNHAQNNKLNGGRVMDSIEFVMRNAKGFEACLNAAEEAKLSDAVIKREYELFQKTGECVFTKKAIPTSVSINQSASAPLDARTGAYINFAGTIFTFVKNKDFDEEVVIDQCRTNKDMKKMLKEITDADVLYNSLLERLKIYGSQTTAHKQKLARFCEELLEKK